MSSSDTAQNASTDPVAIAFLPALRPFTGRIRLNWQKVVSNSAGKRLLCGRICCVDAIDRKILAVLQEDGRLTVTELAARVGLSVSPCHRRLRELERSGTIRGYRAVVDAAALGLTFQALVFVTMRQEDRDTLLGFEAAVAQVPEVVQAQRLFGDPDYLLRIVTADLKAYQELEDDVLAALPGVQRLNSTLVMKHVVNDRPLPT
nr:Lrp/AsnC family transcriptional regulator [Actinomadura citrea]